MGWDGEMPGLRAGTTLNAARLYCLGAIILLLEVERLCATADGVQPQLTHDHIDAVVTSHKVLAQMLHLHKLHTAGAEVAVPASVINEVCCPPS